MCAPAPRGRAEGAGGGTSESFPKAFRLYVTADSMLGMEYVSVFNLNVPLLLKMKHFTRIKSQSESH